MKHSIRAFTLIELLVVIAIVAILAAILFPVFAAAREKAKQTVAISGIKQFGVAMLLYAADYDQKYPRADSCEPGGSLNPALNDPGSVPGDGCTNYPFAYCINHYKWQRWIWPYVNNLPVFFHPVLQKDDTMWNTQGEIMNGYAVNLALTGALNTYGNPNRLGAYRNSFLGGTPDNVPDPSTAFLFMELASTEINFVPVFATPSAAHQTAYPTALRHLWAPMFMKWVGASDCTPTNQVDDQAVVHAGGLLIGRVDTSTKWIAAKEFLAQTPSAADYVVPAYGSGWECGPTSGSRTISSAPVWSKEWPLWALH